MWHWVSNPRNWYVIHLNNISLILFCIFLSCNLKYFLLFSSILLYFFTPHENKTFLIGIPIPTSKLFIISLHKIWFSYWFYTMLSDIIVLFVLVFNWFPCLIQVYRYNMAYTGKKYNICESDHFTSYFSVFIPLHNSPFQLHWG